MLLWLMGSASPMKLSTMAALLEISHALPARLVSSCGLMATAGPGNVGSSIPTAIACLVDALTTTN